MDAGKYARAEIERRFLLAGVPDGEDILAVHEIDDRYLDGTRLRLRRMAEVGGPTALKLTQKLQEPGRDGRQGALTTHPAAFCHTEVTADRRFTGGALVRASRAQVGAWTAEYGIDLPTR